MKCDIHYRLFNDGMGFYAMCQGAFIGQITFVKAGNDKMIIDNTNVAEQYRNKGIGQELVRHAVNYARDTNLKVMTICPFARAMFNRFSEFDDVRLINYGK